MWNTERLHCMSSNMCGKKLAHEKRGSNGIAGCSTTVKQEENYQNWWPEDDSVKRQVEVQWGIKPGIRQWAAYATPGQQVTQTEEPTDQL